MSTVSDLVVAKKFLQLRRSARSRSLEFDLSLADVRRLLNRKRCIYTRVIMNNEPEHIHQRTIDRVDPTKGYIKGNVVACTFEINRAKANLTPEQIKRMYAVCKRYL